MSTGTIRIPREVHQKLKQMAANSGTSMAGLLEKAVEALRRQTLLEETNRAYAALRDNPKLWAEEQAERTAWEATLADGLEDE